METRYLKEEWVRERHDLDGDQRLMEDGVGRRKERGE